MKQPWTVQTMIDGMDVSVAFEFTHYAPPVEELNAYDHLRVISDTTRCHLTMPDARLFVGIANCSTKDLYDHMMGIRLALQRALASHASYEGTTPAFDAAMRQAVLPVLAARTATRKRPESKRYLREQLADAKDALKTVAIVARVEYLFDSDRGKR